MRLTLIVFLILLVMSIGVFTVVAVHPREKLEENSASEVSVSLNNGDTLAAPIGAFVLAGGQNGTWFESGQFPRLYEVSLQSDSYTPLDPVHSGGTIWGGGFNGTQWLVSGWGTDDSTPGPYVWLYDGTHTITAGSLDDYGQASSWYGGDIFAASYNGNEWLVSGLGSGVLPSLSDNATNHYSLGTFNGKAFTDLSSLVPDQQDGILYTNAWNGAYWLVGGGYMQHNVLFTFDGHRFTDLTEQAENEIGTFASVQAVAWNGNYWLVGGTGFLAKYDGHHFFDLTEHLESAVSTDFYSVNAIAWNGNTWMIGGGAPIALVAPSDAWIATYNGHTISNLSSILPTYVAKSSHRDSSVLGITEADGVWIFGGYSNNRGILLAYDGRTLTDYSRLVTGLTYVDWVSCQFVLEFGNTNFYRHDA
ncbi:MAG TPA: hypothetical protein VLV31_11440 [Candidatus Acidoferrales bacterium]|nr:hypothetical protein [Candidatus Acidoferrales bacterium]